MKAIILAAGKNFGDIPKCLYHVGGELLLERKIQMLRQLGVSDIRVVVGWKKEEIERFDREKNLKLELVYNPDWSSNAIKSLTTGLQGVDDDVLIILADLLIRLDVIEGLLRCDAPLCCIRLLPHLSWQHPSAKEFYPWGVGVQPWICKVSRKKIPVLIKEAQKYTEKWVAEKGRGALGCGGVIVDLLREIFEMFKHEAGGAIAAYVIDIDQYELTDEGRGMNFEKRA